MYIYTYMYTCTLYVYGMHVIYFPKVLLIVNVASECGYTDLNYRELVQLQNEFGSQGFSVLAFPCNQFGGQEPGSMQEIVAFAESYGVNFPLFSKVDVVGKDASEVYKHLFRATGAKPTWNFCKYLVNERGAVVQFFSQKQKFASIRQGIQFVLKKRDRSKHKHKHSEL